MHCTILYSIYSCIGSIALPVTPDIFAFPRSGLFKRRCGHHHSKSAVRSHMGRIIKTGKKLSRQVFDISVGAITTIGLIYWAPTELVVNSD